MNKPWIFFVVAILLLVVGELVAFPGKDGQHLAGMTLIIAGLNLVIKLIKKD